MKLVRVFVALGGLLAAFLFAALIAPFFVDWTSFRTSFEAEATRLVGRSVRVTGEADARILPFPSLTFSGIEIGEGPDGKPMMVADRFSMDAELAPFLRGEVLIFDMRLDNPKATIRIGTEGTLDWALGRTPPTGETIIFERISVTGGEITLIDEKNARSVKADGIDATLSAKALSGPWTIDAQGTLAGHKGAVSLTTGEVRPDGSVRLKARLQHDQWPAFVETEGDARIEDGRPLYGGTFTASLMRAAAEPGNPPGLLVSARGSFDANNERLTIPDWRAEVGLADDPYIVTGEAALDTGAEPGFLILADGQQVDIDRLNKPEGKTDRPKTNTPKAAGERIATLNALLARIPVPSLPGRISLNLPAIVAGETVFRDIAINARPDGTSWQIDKVRAALPGRTTVEAAGRYKPETVDDGAAFDGTLTLASTQPSGLANWLTGDVDPVIRRLAAAGLSAKVSLSRQLQRFEALELAIGNVILKGRFEREAVAGKTPALSLDLSGDALDIDALRALAGLAGAGGDAALFSGHNAAVRLAAGQVTASGYVADGVETSFSWRDGTLTLDRLSFDDFAGAAGTFSGRLTGRMTAPSGELDGQLTARSADSLFAVAARLTDNHPAVLRLATGAAAWRDLDANLSLALDQDAGPVLDVNGTAGGTAFSLRAAGTGLVPGGDGPLTVAVSAENPETAPLLTQAGFTVLPLEGTGPATLMLDLSGQINEPDMDMVARFQAGETEASLSGTGALGRDGRVQGAYAIDLSSPDLEPLLFLFGQALPGAGEGLPVALRTRADFGPESIALDDLTGTIDGNVLSGTLSLSREDLPVLTGTLETDTISVAWLSDLMLGPDNADDGSKAFSETPFLPPADRPVNLDIAVTARNADFGTGALASELSGRIVLVPGRLDISDVRARWLDGAFAGDLRLANPDGNVFLSGGFQLSDASSKAAAPEMAQAVNAEGRVSLETTFEAAGTTRLDLARSLSGGGALTFKDLTFTGIDRSAFPRVLEAIDAEGFEIGTDTVASLVSGLMKGGTVSAPNLAMPFTLTAGQMRFAPVTLADEGGELSGDIRADLAALALTAEGRLTFDAGVEAVAGADPAIDLSISGDLQEPTVTLDPAPLVNFLSVRAFERERRRVELLQAGVIERQRLRRIIALTKEQESARAEAARIAAEEAEQQRLADAARQAEEEARRLAEEEEARRVAEEAANAATEEARREQGRESQRAFVRGFDGGPCFFARLVEGGADRPQIEGIGQSPDAFRELDAAFRGWFGEEPALTVHLLSSDQCLLTDALKRIGDGQAGPVSIALDRDRILPGEPLAGVIRGLGDAPYYAYLFDHAGFVYRIDTFIKREGSEGRFNLRLGGAGDANSRPQLMLALKTEVPLAAAEIAGPVIAETFFPALLAALEAGSVKTDIAYAYFELGSAGQ